MKIRLFLALSLLTAALSCRDEDSLTRHLACGVRDPLNNLPWLKAQMDDARQKKEENITTVVATEFKGQQYIRVYKMYMSCSFCALYTCDGNPVDMSGLSTADQQALIKQVTEGQKQVTLWPER
ncbi:hypothetical protein [Tellurirhabdus rosea]|uniref:hypothetical protein n=1 Tax=Tellurirhabdus rosea TaxID=2674997 RepID=UPI00224F8D34|nr:hypothetical protein [Tellurirhabdus rosea]